jgi:predicted membrane-bound mannosyltransferase
VISSGRVSLRGPRRALWALLAVSAALRVALVFGGGQRFFPDENRYLRCFILLRHLEHGDLGAATDFVLHTPDHTGFLAVGLLPALPQRALLYALGLVPDKPAIDATAWLPALFFACASLAAIVLVGAIARRCGAGERESLLAALLMACSSVMFYYSRHFFPYDAALALALWALWLGLSEGPGFARSLLVGLVAGAAFMTYNG